MNSIIKIIDRFGAVYDPSINKPKPGSSIGLPISYAVASSWLLDAPVDAKSKVSLELECIDPQGKVVGNQSHPIKIPAGKDRINLNFNVQGLIVSTSGVYTLKGQLFIDGEAVAETEYPYEVQLESQKEQKA